MIPNMQSVETLEKSVAPVPPVPASSSTFHLLVESTAFSGNPAAAGEGSVAGAAVLVVPAGVSALPIHAGAELRLTAAPTESPMEAPILEPILLRDGQPRLLLVIPASCAVRVNEGRAPRVIVMRERDQFQFEPGHVFHVAVFCHRQQTGPAPASYVGKPCPICLTLFTDDPASICYRCQCGTLLHLQDSPGLECARAVRECPHCHQPISLEEGYSWLPNLES